MVSRRQTAESTWELKTQIHELRTSVLPLLQYVTRKIGDYTNHGIAHSEELERIIRNVVEICNSRTRKCNISPFEEHLLLSSAWLHDIGNLMEREKHNESTCRLIRKLAGRYILGIEDDSIELICWICYAHSRRVDINEVPEEVQLEGTIKLRFLSALFRLIDASDMASRRAPLSVFSAIEDQLDDESKEQWSCHHAVMDVSFREETKEIIVTVTDKGKARRAVEEFREEFQSVQEVLTGYDFPCTRIRVVQIQKVPVEETAE